MLAILVVVGVALTSSAFRTPRAIMIDSSRSSGVHLTFIVIAPTSPGNRDLVSAIREARDSAREFAKRSGYHFSTVGVSDDWSVSRGQGILREMGDFDEVDVGRNWFNLGTNLFVGEMQAIPAVPQILVLLQRVVVDTVPFRRSSPYELIRLVGHGEILSWKKSGFRWPKTPELGPILTSG